MQDTEKAGEPQEKVGGAHWGPGEAALTRATTSARRGGGTGSSKHKAKKGGGDYREARAKLCAGVLSGGLGHRLLWLLEIRASGDWFLSLLLQKKKKKMRLCLQIWGGGLPCSARGSPVPAPLQGASPLHPPNLRSIPFSAPDSPLHEPQPGQPAQALRGVS